MCYQHLVITMFVLVPLRRLICPADFSNCSQLRHTPAYISVALLFCIAAACWQVVIIAAGYDTRAYRLGKPGVKFYEIDLPHASEKKQELVREHMPADKVCRVHNRQSITLFAITHGVLKSYRRGCTAIVVLFVVLCSTAPAVTAQHFRGAGCFGFA